MRIPPTLLHVAVLLAAGLAAALSVEAAEPQGKRHEHLIKLVRQECGSCHGLTLAGGLGPALLPENIAHKPLDSMVATVMNGRPGTAMPGWSRFISEDEAEWMVRSMMKGFPELNGARK